jgi:UPF0755 protein
MGRLRTFGLILGGIFIVLLIAVASVAVVVNLRLGSPGPLAREKVVLVPDGVGMKTIANIFEQQGVVESAKVFVWVSRASRLDRDIQAGEYLVPPHASMRELLHMLRAGQVVLHKLTIPEGLTSLQILHILDATPELKGKVAAVPAEGSLLPQTYFYIRGNTRDEIITRMQRAMTDFLDNAWPLRAKDLPLATPREALILASIVEKETGSSDERAHVAGVYINRLRKDMPLQADPTVAYGLGGGEMLNRSLTLKDLREPTPYNTYMFKGLPPGPIANPGAKAIEAVLNPLNTKDLYFVADGTGGHSFAETLKQHNENVAKWRRIEEFKSGN